MIIEHKKVNRIAREGLIQRTRDSSGATAARVD